jgi:hypothetical protein
MFKTSRVREIERVPSLQTGVPVRAVVPSTSKARATMPEFALYGGVGRVFIGRRDFTGGISNDTPKRLQQIATVEVRDYAF